MRISTKMAVVALFGMTLVGCGNGNATQESQTNGQQNSQETAAAPKQDDHQVGSTQSTGGKKYTVITTGTADPFSMKDENGMMSGIDVEIIRAIGQIEGFEVDFFESPWQDVLPSIEKKEYDIAVNGINYSDERNGKYGLTNGYFYNPSAFMYKKDAKKQPKTLADLTGLTVAVMKDAKPDIEISAMPDVKLEQEPNLFTSYKMLVQGKADVVAYDMAVMQSLLKKHNDTTMTIVPYEDKSNKDTYNIFVVHKDNQELLKKLNSGLEKLQQNGTIDEIRKKYVGE